MKNLTVSSSLWTHKTCILSVQHNNCSTYYTYTYFRVYLIFYLYSSTFCTVQKMYAKLLVSICTFFSVFVINFTSLEATAWRYLSSLHTNALLIYLIPTLLCKVYYKRRSSISNWIYIRRLFEEWMMRSPVRCSPGRWGWVLSHCLSFSISSGVISGFFSYSFSTGNFFTTDILLENK